MKTAIAALALLSCGPSRAADDATGILRRYKEAESKNDERARQYTYVEHVDHLSYNKLNEPKKEQSETFDVMFVEGDTYKRLIARNDLPLDAATEATEEKKLKQAAKERRKQRRSGMLSKSVDLSSDAELLTLFDSRIVAEEEIRGHKAWVVECTPKAGRPAANKHEKDAMSFSRRLWIDQSDYVALRSVETVIGQHLVLMPGSSMTWEFEKINDEVWHGTSLTIDGRLQIAKLIKPRVRTEYKSSMFRKFDVKSTITVEPDPR